MPLYKLLILIGLGSNYHDEPSLEGLKAQCATVCKPLNAEASFCLANSHAEMLSALEVLGSQHDAIVVDPGTEIKPNNRTAIENALADFGQQGLPMVEVHGDNIFRTANSRAHALKPSGTHMGLVCGLGTRGYLLAIQALVDQLGGDSNACKHAQPSGRIRVLNGPNLNLLGTREPEIYGRDSLTFIEQRCREKIKSHDVQLEFLQSNHEGQIIDWIQESIGEVDTLVVNAGAYTHTSVAIHDALKAFKGFTLELHISNPHLREPFRHTSYVSFVADAVIAGLGTAGYDYSLQLTASDSTSG